MGRSSDGVEPGHTPRPRVGRRVRMLLSFQRPSHLFREGFLLRGTPGSRNRFPGRTDEYSARLASLERVRSTRLGVEPAQAPSARAKLNQHHSGLISGSGPARRPLRYVVNATPEPGRTTCLLSGPPHGFPTGPTVSRPASDRAVPDRPRSSLPGLPGYDKTCTVTVRVRGRSSKSIKTSCCQVPRARRPSTTGTVSEGPITAARMCAWALVSWLSRLCW
jgi:hypothetical protein